MHGWNGTGAASLKREGPGTFAVGHFGAPQNLQRNHNKSYDEYLMDDSTFYLIPQRG